jgi:hypothetical protein
MHIVCTAELWDGDARGKPRISIYYDCTHNRPIEEVAIWGRIYRISRWADVHRQPVRHVAGGGGRAPRGAAPAGDDAHAARSRREGGEPAAHRDQGRGEERHAAVPGRRHVGRHGVRRAPGRGAARDEHRREGPADHARHGEGLARRAAAVLLPEQAARLQPGLGSADDGLPGRPGRAGVHPRRAAALRADGAGAERPDLRGDVRGPLPQRRLRLAVRHAGAAQERRRRLQASRARCTTRSRARSR